MTRKTLVTAILALALVAGGLVVASNMGFKYVPNLVASDNFRYLSFPYNNNYTVASDVCTDLGPTQEVQRLDPVTQLFTSWTCAGTGTDFTLVPYEGLNIKMSSNATPVVVGSHDPSAVVPSGGWVSTNDHVVSIPYHTTATLASDICTEVDSGAGAGAAKEVQTINASSGLFTSWTCAGTGTDFSLTLGEALFIKVNSAPATGFMPSHY